MNRSGFKNLLLLAPAIYCLGLCSLDATSEDRGWQDTLAGIRWVDYSPSTGDPQRGLEPSLESIRQDLARLRDAHFTGLVTYSASGRLGSELRSLAKAAGFRGLVIGIWDPTNKVEMRAAIQAAAADIVLGICVGNEGLMDHRYSWPSLQATIQEIRAATKKPVTTTEIIQQYDAKLLNVVDWAFPNAHPYFSHQTEPRAAVVWTQDAYRRLTRETSRLVMLKEVGLPTDGDADRVLSERAQCDYYDALAQTEVRFVYFEAFDLLWKSHLPIEAHWGIFHSDRTPKVLARRLSDQAACAANTVSTSEAPVATGPSTVLPVQAQAPRPSADTFYVYQDSESRANHFRPTGRMGDVGDIRIAEDWTDKPKSGKTSIKVEYLARGNEPTCEYRGPCKWAGMYWQEPPGNWGKNAEWKSGGYDLSRYTSLRFWARADRPATVEFKVGGIVGPYGDSLRPARSQTAKLTPEWAEFVIDLSGANLKYIIGGFSWVASKEQNPGGATFYLDEIRFEYR